MLDKFEIKSKIETNTTTTETKMKQYDFTNYDKLLEEINYLGFQTEYLQKHPFYG